MSVASTSGVRTSELWTTVATAGLAIANRKYGLGLTEVEVASIAGAVAAYVLSRGWVKRGF